jgi:hypothetical protein
MPRPAEELLQDPQIRGVLMAASRDPDAKLTFVVPPPPTGLDGRRRDGLVVKVPSTHVAGAAVEREGRMLVTLRRAGLGALADTVPRYVESRQVDGRPVLVCTALPGTPMSISYHQPFHTALPSLVRADYAAAAAWLRQFQDLTSCGTELVTWGTDMAEELRRRWDGDPLLPAALDRLDHAQRRMDGQRTLRTAVHGDFWFGNLLITRGAVSGVVDWEAGTPSGSPLTDLARFALSYSLYLDRHTRPGHRVLGHRGLRRTGFAPGVTHALLDDGWYPDLVRGFLSEGLRDLGLPVSLWYDVALVGLADVAASANHDDFGHGHLKLLAELPLAHGRWNR